MVMNCKLESYFYRMIRPEFDDIYMELAVNLAKRSHCIKRHVGAVLTKDTRIISIGYNGPPSGTHNCDVEWPQTGCPRDSKGGCSLAIHAEQNAILYAVKNKTSVDGATLYITLSPCLACSRIIYSMGIKKVIYLNSYAEYKGIPNDEGLDFLREIWCWCIQISGATVQCHSYDIATAPLAAFQHLFDVACEFCSDTFCLIFFRRLEYNK